MTASQKIYIIENRLKMSMQDMARELRTPYSRIRKYMIDNNLNISMNEAIQIRCKQTQNKLLIMKKLINRQTRLFRCGVSKRFLGNIVSIYIHLSLLAVTSLLVLLSVFGGSVNITINWDSWQKLLDSISNVC